MTVASIKVAESPLVLYALRRADDALILGHRLSEWCGHAPMMEVPEDFNRVLGDFLARHAG